MRSLLIQGPVYRGQISEDREFSGLLRSLVREVLHMLEYTGDNAELSCRLYVDHG